jgi:endo-1,4-beta-xylanase
MRIPFVLYCLAAGICLMAGSAVYLATSGHAQATTRSTTTLKTAFKDDFRIGASLNRAQFEARDAQGEAIIIAEFNTITPESGLKWEPLHG